MNGYSDFKEKPKSEYSNIYAQSVFKKNTKNDINIFINLIMNA